MDAKALRYFVEVIRQHGFTRAAETLCVTQPTISKMVRGLEDELGQALLVRDGRRVRPTDAGLVVYERGQQLLAGLHHLRQELDDLAELARGELTLGIPPMAGRYFARLIGRYRQLYPGVTLRLFEQGGRALEQAVRDGELDIGVTVLPAADPALETLPAARHPLVVVLPAGRPVGDGGLRLTDLKAEGFVLYDDDFVLTGRIVAACRTRGFEPVVAGRSRQWDFIGELVAADVGVAILPAPVAAGLDPSRVIIRPLLGSGLEWQLGLVWQPGYLSHAARAWLDLCRDAFGPE